MQVAARKNLNLSLKAENVLFTQQEFILLNLIELIKWLDRIIFYPI